MVEINWYNECKVYVRNPTDRNLKAFFGVTFIILENIWEFITPGNIKPKHLLWSMAYLKLYNTEDVMSNMFKCDQKTFRKYVRLVLLHLDEVLPDVIFSYILIP